MTSLYLFSLVSGGIVLLASILIGDKDSDPGDLDLHGDVHPDLPERGVRRLSAGALVLLALRSVRFWTFALTFFGLTGVSLAGAVDDERALLVLAAAVAFAIGLLAFLVIRRLAVTETNTAADERDFVGKRARVIVAVASGGLGKVRVESRAGAVDLLAKTDEAEPLAVGDDALIIHMHDTTAVVVRPPADDVDG
ncbi:MAG: DUF1449 family protein [Myxococcales bacterium]|nr:DUF1449 family protein [Myxococcales bacterium]